MRRLVPQRTLVEQVPQEPEPKDGQRQPVACRLRVPAEEAGQDLVVVLCMSGLEPEKRIEMG